MDHSVDAALQEAAPSANAYGDLPLPTPTPPPTAIRAPEPGSWPIPEWERSDRAGMAHRISGQFLLAEAIGVGMGTAGAIGLIVTGSQRDFGVAQEASIVVMVVGFGGATLAAPGQLISETWAWGALPHTSPVGLILGYTGLALLGTMPLASLTDAWEIQGFLAAGGCTLGVIGGPIQYVIDGGALRRPIHLVIAPTGTGFMAGATF